MALARSIPVRTSAQGLRCAGKIPEKSIDPTLAPPYEGAGNCYVEFGGGLVGKVEANFLGGPHPTARLIEPSKELAAEKKAFGATRRERWFAA